MRAATLAFAGVLVACGARRAPEVSSATPSSAPSAADPPDVPGDGYVSVITRQNQRAIAERARAFAMYLNAIHTVIHPIFADGYLASLDERPKSDPENDPKLFTRVEVAIGRDGWIVRRGVVRTSGVRAFDEQAIGAFERAQPFPPPPAAVLSPDGNVYFHWELHRDGVYGCNTMNARPFLLAAPALPTAPQVDL